jgi:hypothetical protein
MMAERAEVPWMLGDNESGKKYGAHKKQKHTRCVM